jgi:hypothetical protein
VKIPPAPFGKGGGVRGSAKGEIFGVFFGLSLNHPPGPLCERGRYFGLWEGVRYLGLCERGRYSEAIFGLHAGKDRMPASFRKQQNIPPFEKGGSGGISHEKGGSGGISIVILVTPKSVIPNSPPRIACHPGKHQRARHSSNPPPPPAVFPTADSSPRFARFGMTRERNCHPEERQPPVSSRGASVTRNPQLRAKARGEPKPEKTLQGIIAKL